MGFKNKLQDEYVAARRLILLAPCYAKVQLTFSWNRKTSKSNVLLSGTNSYDADTSKGYSITNESESNTSSKLRNTRQEATHVKTFAHWCWSSLWKTPRTGLNCDGTCFNQRWFDTCFLSVNWISSQMLWAALWRQKDQESECWRPCLHNSPRPLPIKGVWNGALSLARGYTEHRGRFVCKAARVILSNQAGGGVWLNTLLWVILEKSS